MLSRPCVPRSGSNNAVLPSIDVPWNLREETFNGFWRVVTLLPYPRGDASRYVRVIIRWKFIDNEQEAPGGHFSRFVGVLEAVR